MFPVGTDRLKTYRPHASAECSANVLQLDRYLDLVFPHRLRLAIISPRLHLVCCATCYYNLLRSPLHPPIKGPCYIFLFCSPHKFSLTKESFLLPLNLLLLLQLNIFNDLEHAYMVAVIIKKYLRTHNGFQTGIFKFRSLRF